MRIIFLDHYGVMCLSKFNVKRTINSLPSSEELKGCKPFDDFDKNAVSILNSIIKETNAEIVVSSDWKYYSTIEEMSKFYLSQGVIKPPISFTLKDSSKNINVQRYNEINNWIVNNPNITHWVSIDDLYLELDNFIWCKYPMQGITEIGLKEKIEFYLR